MNRSYFHVVVVDACPSVGDVHTAYTLPTKRKERRQIMDKKIAMRKRFVTLTFNLSIMAIRNEIFSETVH